MIPRFGSHLLHFDFTHLSQEHEYRLLGGEHGEFVLKRYADHPAKLDEHRAKNQALGMMSEEELAKLTHFVDDAILPLNRTLMKRVVFDSLDDHPLPEIAMVFPHIPEAHVHACHSRFYRGKHSPVLPCELAHFSVDNDGFMSRATEPGMTAAQLHAAASAAKPPASTAQALVLHHPELGSVSPGVMTFVKDNYLNPVNNPEMADFVSYIQRQSPGQGSFTWYNKSWAKWAQNDDGTGPLVPAEVDTSIKYKDGKTKTDWPQAPGQNYQGMPSYDLTDEYDPPQGDKQNESVIEASTLVVRSTLLGTKNDERLNGALWTKQEGVTELSPSPAKVVNSGEPVSTAAKSAAETNPVLAAAVSAAKGFSVKNKTSTYGLYQYDLTYDTANNNVTLPLKNWPSRYLGAYVQFQKEDGSVIKRSDIPNWPDFMPIDFVEPFVQPSDSKNFLTWLSSGNAVFGVPVPPLTQKTDLTFPWPKEASRALILLGGLGCAAGFKDWDSDVDIVGVIGTGIMNYGVGVFSLALTVYVVNPFIEGLQGDAQIAFYIVCALVGVVGTIVGVAEKDNSFGKFILSKLAGFVASALFGALAKKAIPAAAKLLIQKFFGLSAAFMAEISAEEAAEIVPVAGWALKVASVAADLAALTATTVECVLSPATYELEILHTMDLQVTVKPDPTHAKTGFSPVWPLVSDHYVIQVKYPSGNGNEGGTTYTKAGPMPGQHDEDIVVMFEGIPAGGKVEVTANIYSDTNWLAGAWNSGWVDAVPDANDQLALSGAIKEFLVPLTSTTTYSQKQTIDYSQDKQHFWQVTAFSIDQGLAADLDKGGTPDANITSAFDDNGNTLSGTANITVNSPLSKWTIDDSTTGATFEINARLLFTGQVFQLDASKYAGDLDKGGATPASIQTAFDDSEYTLPKGTQVTVVTAGQKWTIAMPNGLPLYALATAGDKIEVDQTAYELSVQNTAQPAPPKPQTYPLSTPSGNALGALQNIIHNNHEFQLGYAYLASGQNMPIDNQPGNTGVPMYAMQSISTLGQPQDQIYQPTRGFSQPSFIAYDQFGLTALFALDKSLAGQLQDGPVSEDVAIEFTAFGYALPDDAQVTQVTAGQNWTIGVANDTPLYELKITTVQDEHGNPQQEIAVFTYPVPSLDNFFFDPQPAVKGQPLEFYLRGIKLNLPPGEYDFDYESPDIWGIFKNDKPFSDFAVHPSGYAIGLDVANSKLFTLKLPADAVDPKSAAYAMPLSGKGGREGLLDNPEAMTITADGRILVLETGTQYIDQKRIQAFDVRGNPVPSFSVGQPNFEIATDTATFIAQLDDVEVSQALLNLFQMNIQPAQAPKAQVCDDLSEVAAALDKSSVDDHFLTALMDYGLAKPDAKCSDFTVLVTAAGSLWFVTDTVSQAVYDVRLEEDPNTGFQVIDIYSAFALSVALQSRGSKWKISDSNNAMTFDISLATKSKTLIVQQLSSFMPLREQQAVGTLSYLDIACETKGFIYVLAVDHGSSELNFQLDIYNPDGSPLLDQPQQGVNAGKITVDQYRSLYSLNYNVVIGPNTRTEPGVSAWIPSTPTPAEGSSS